ncbi:aldo/keto reductase [Hoeflea poritis]|uniref:Aldo/keto reductase n=1 Tax=Hoeflea poritis TaxID=2993659 RepID=A0ABT4VL26_9HYPH|nr:aldo/keto reductase [Hoeflea poritis]MDA4845381.1 aldo/keto reductase [Hoeflea poritis]
MNIFKNKKITIGDSIVGPMGMGTWALRGPFFSGEKWVLPKGTPIGYGNAEDSVSIRAIHCALDCGAKLIDTADAYGAGHCERVIGEALTGRRDRVFLATKFGNVIDEDRKELIGQKWSERYIRAACEASLHRLKTEIIDLYQLHISDLEIDAAQGVAEVLEGLRREGKIRYFGWSTDDPERANSWSGHDGAAAAQFNMNVFQQAPEMLEICHQNDFAALIRLPLAMGLLSGKYTPESRLPKDDIRSAGPDWQRYFLRSGGANREWTERLEAIREVLTSSGRTLVQGALAWIWAQSDRAVPIPGIRNEEQARENLTAIEFGPLTATQVDEINAILDRS